MRVIAIELMCVLSLVWSVVWDRIGVAAAPSPAPESYGVEASRRLIGMPDVACIQPKIRQSNSVAIDQWTT